MTIALHIISTHRADFGHLEPLVTAADADKRFTVNFSHSDSGSIPTCFRDDEVVFIQGDRTELLEAAARAVRGNCILAHAAGGERTKGSTDDRVRDALTKLAHLHYPVHQQAWERLLLLQEESWRIRVVGEIGVDAIKNGAEAELPAGLHPQNGDIVVAVHPVTARTAETDRVLFSVGNVTENWIGKTWLVSPNGDPGSAGIDLVWEAWCRLRGSTRCERLPSLTQPQFCTLMKRCGTIIGNSSCLITEAPHLGVLPILIGTRQEGRIAAPSDGNACKLILDHLAKCRSEPSLRIKA